MSLSVTCDNSTNEMFAKYINLLNIYFSTVHERLRSSTGCESSNNSHLLSCPDICDLYQLCCSPVLSRIIPLNMTSFSQKLHCGHLTFEEGTSWEAFSLWLGSKDVPFLCHYSPHCPARHITWQAKNILWITTVKFIFNGPTLNVIFRFSLSCLKNYWGGLAKNNLIANSSNDLRGVLFGFCFEGMAQLRRPAASLESRRLPAFGFILVDNHIFSFRWGLIHRNNWLRKPMRLFDCVQLASDDEHYLQVAPKNQDKADMGLFTVKTY